MDSQALERDTIAAVATPAGRGGVSIVRVSGPLALSIADTITHKALAVRTPTLCQFYEHADGIIDEGIVLVFAAPRSFTGEDVVEFHGHGGVVITDMVLRRCCELGARLARPGEFSERAFLNNKLDLTQVEALADLIDAKTQQAARQASASLRGAFSQAVNAINRATIELRVYVEAAIDFPEEEVDFLGDEKIGRMLSTLHGDINALISSARQGAILNHGAAIALVGLPNAGKSSLLNRLAQDNVAIVTDVPGTTRDVIRQQIALHGIPIQLSDTAGLRDSPDQIEQEGIKRAHSEMRLADLIIEVVDDTSAARATLVEQYRVPVITALNKIDLSGRPEGVVGDSSNNIVAVSAETGAGIEKLEQHILTCLGVVDTDASSCFSARARHLSALEQARDLLLAAETRFRTSLAGELLAEDLREIHDVLGAITGEFGVEALLGEIFSSFCIGK